MGQSFDAFGHTFASELPALLAGQESTASTTQNLALGVATNMRATGIHSPDQQAKLSQLEQDIQSGQRSLQFESVANLTGPDGGAANAKYMHGTDKALLNRKWTTEFDT